MLIEIGVCFAANKCMGALLLVRIGVAYPNDKKVFWHPVWNKDVKGKPRSELESDARAFFQTLLTPPYGVFDAFVRVLGTEAAIEVCSGHTLIRPQHHGRVVMPVQTLSGRGSGSSSPGPSASSRSSASVWV